MTKAQAEQSLRQQLSPGQPVTILPGRTTRRQHTIVRFLTEERDGSGFTLDLSQEIAVWLERPPLPHGILLGREEKGETIVAQISTALFGDPQAVPWRYL